MDKIGLYVRLQAKPGKGAAVQAFLLQGARMAQDEPGTRSWFGLDEGDGVYSVFDSFDDETGREAHLNGAIAKALMASGDELFLVPPQIHKVRIIAAK